MVTLIPLHPETFPSFPLVVRDNLQDLTKTTEARDVLTKLGTWEDVDRVLSSIKIRSRGASARGRGKKHSIGPLIVVAKNKGIIKAVRNITGVDAVEIDNLNASLLAPGTHPGRLTIWTESAIKKLEEFES